MELRPGYKQTDVGVIPEDWSVRPLLTAVRIAKGQVDPKTEPYKSMILVAPDHIESGTGRLLDTQTAADQRAISGKYIFAKGDIVYSKIRPYLRKAILAKFDGLCSADMYPLRTATDVAAGYMLAVILGQRFSKYAESVSVRSGMPKINRAELAEYYFALPPTKSEQEAIAEALNDVDNLLESLEQLIAKKRHLKKGAMQELLTGKKRLPGFGNGKLMWKHTEVGISPEDWAAVRLSEVAEKITVGFVGSMAHLFRTQGVPLLRGQNVLPHKLNLNEMKYISIETHKQWKKSSLNPGDIVMVRVGYPGTSCVIPPNFGPVNAASLVVVRPSWHKLDAKYLCYVLNSDFGKNQIDSYLVGGAQQVLNTNTAAMFSFLLPPSKDEQTAIATVLCEMDAEITAIEEKLTKARQLKQGMMQDLLNGKIRLV